MAFSFLYLPGSGRGVAAGRLWWWLGALGLLAGCRPAPQSRLVHIDYDSAAGWVSPLPPDFTVVKAHSGHYAVVLPANQFYASSYQTSWSVLNNARRIHLQMWCWLPNGRSNIEFVLEGWRGSEPVARANFRISENVRRYGQWEKVEGNLTLPDDMLPTDHLKMYLWQRETCYEDLYFDDIILDKLQ